MTDLMKFASKPALYTWMWRFRWRASPGRILFYFFKKLLLLNSEKKDTRMQLNSPVCVHRRRLRPRSSSMMPGWWPSARRRNRRLTRWQMTWIRSGEMFCGEEETNPISSLAACRSQLSRFDFSICFLIRVCRSSPSCYGHPYYQRETASCPRTDGY